MNIKCKQSLQKAISMKYISFRQHLNKLSCNLKHLMFDSTIRDITTRHKKYVFIFD